MLSIKIHVFIFFQAKSDCYTHNNGIGMNRIKYRKENIEGGELLKDAWCMAKLEPEILKERFRDIICWGYAASVIMPKVSQKISSFFVFITDIFD